MFTRIHMKVLKANGVNLKNILIHIFFLERGRERGKGRQRKAWISCLLHAPRDPARSSRHVPCLDRTGDDTQPTEPHLPGLK